MRKLTSPLFLCLFGFYLLSSLDAQAANDLEKINQVRAQDFGNVKTSAEEKSARVQNAQAQPQASQDSKSSWRIRPYVKQSFRLTNNVFKDPNGDKVRESTLRTRKMDGLWTTTPGVSLRYKKGSTLIGATYEADFQYFSKYSEQNAQNQNAGGVMLFAPTEKSYVRITEDYSRKELTSGFINLKPVSVTQNDLQLTGGYKLDSWTLEAGYRNYLRNFHSDVNAALDYFQNEYSLTGYYEKSDALRPFARTKLIQVDYSHAQESRDAVAFDNRIGFMSERRDQQLEFQGDAGFYLRDQRHTDNVNHPDYFVASFLARKTLAKKTVLEAGFFREPRESTFSSTTVYVENALYFGVSKPVTKKLSTRANIIGSWQRYPDAALADSRFMKRRDSTLGLNLGADYVFNRNVALRLDYKLDRRNSNFHDFDYTENSLLSKLIVAL